MKEVSCEINGKHASAALRIAGRSRVRGSPRGEKMSGHEKTRIMGVTATRKACIPA
jgi:hypothetical protein